MATPRDITVRLQAVLDRGGRNGASSNDIESCLIEIWLDDYAHGRSTEQVVRVQAQGFNYLFDIATERLIAAWGLSRGANHAPRPEARMRGFPLSAGPLFHRGHAIAHQLGGGPCSGAAGRDRRFPQYLDAAERVAGGDRDCCARA